MFSLLMRLLPFKVVFRKMGLDCGDCDAKIFLDVGHGIGNW
jgi:hypothetical protein